VKSISAEAVDRSLWLAAIVESSDDAILSTSCGGAIVTWNSATERLYGYRAEEVIGRPVSLLLPEDRPGQVEEVMCCGAAPIQIETKRVRKDGTLVDVSLSVSPVLDDAGKVVGATTVARNLTALAEIEEQQRRAQKLEALGSLAGGVAHDFNNLLTVILGFGTIALEPLSPEEAREAIEEIIRAAERAGDLTRQLLAFSRQESAVTYPVDVNGIIRNLTSMLGRVVPKDIQLEILLDPGLTPVVCDPTQLEQVVMNLAVNARDAMPTGGRLTIATRLIGVGEEHARERDGLEPGTYAAIVVADTGVGMTPDTQANVFEPFFTTKPAGSGTGLGLATVLRIVEETGGRVAISSEPGSGTIVTVYLPCEPASALAEDNGHTILLVEDDEGLRRLAATVLRLNGYRVLPARSGQEAIEAARTHAGSIELVLSDVFMPQMSGPELVQRLGELGLVAPTLFMSGYRDEEIADQGVERSNGAVLGKPFTPDSLLDRVRTTLARVKEHV